MTTTETPPEGPVPIGYILVRPGAADEDRLMADWDGIAYPTLEAAKAELPLANTHPSGWYVCALFRVEGCED